MQKHDLMINFCKETAKLSKCTDKKTATILVSMDMMQIFSIGINGGPKGGEQCLCGPETLDDTLCMRKQKYTCAHSEMNCLVKNTNLESDKIMICMKQPCQMCATLIVNSQANIKELWYIDDYWNQTGLKILIKAGIHVAKLTEYENGKFCFK